MSDNNVQYTLSLRDLLSGKLQEADEAANKLDGTMNGLQSSVSGLGTAIGVAFGLAAINNFTRGIVDAGSKVEDARTGLTTLLKDSDAAAQVIQNTMKDATTTPFEFEGLLNANKALIAANVSATDARQTVLDLANAVAATGGGNDELNRMVLNLQQIKNVGKATEMDIKQFAMAGINVYEMLAKATGKSTEAVKDMGVSYDLLSFALNKAHETGGIYANGLENMSKNTSTQMSNISDAIFDLKVQMFDDLRPAIQYVISGIAGFVHALQDGWTWIVKNKDAFETIGLTIAVTGSGLLAYNAIVNASTIATNIVTAATWLWNAAINASPVGWITTGIGFLVAGVISAYKHFGTFRAVLWGVWGTIKEFGGIVADVFSGLWHIIHGVFTLSASEIKLGAKEQVDAMFNAGKRLGEGFKHGYDAGMADFAKSQMEDKNSPTVNAPVKVGKQRNAVPLMAANSNKETSRVTGNKSTTISIKIENLIKGGPVFNTTNIQESASKLKEAVVQALLSAVNDSQIVAGQ